ncbi:uncharacterized protein LOC109726886, partial [Ananas comosus]|uniref:Uncharacterized protein LOC109726886 n=1 Tax=Ananas comosus TaxID=4615 RepID=A0A6P5H3A8_ANACO
GLLPWRKKLKPVARTREPTLSPHRPPIIPRAKRPPISASSSPPLPATKKARDLPDISLCHCCGLRFPSDSISSSTTSGAGGGIGIGGGGGGGLRRKRRLRILRSQWRIVLLCSYCLVRVRSAAICSYCFAADAAGSASLRCLRCSRRVHVACLPREHRSLASWPPDPASFVCADCRPIPKLLFTNNRSSSSSSSTSNNNHSSLSVSLDDLVIEARSDAKKKAELASFAMNNAFNKAAMAKHAADRAKAALRVVLGNSPNELKANGDSAIPDEELALQLHLAMNGSERISRNSVTDKRKRRKNGELSSNSRFGKGEMCEENKFPFDGTEGRELKSNLGMNSSSIGTKKKKKEIIRYTKRRPLEMGQGYCPASRKEELVDPNCIVLALECERNGGAQASESEQIDNAPDRRYLKKYSKKKSTVKEVSPDDDGPVAVSNNGSG